MSSQPDDDVHLFDPADFLRAVRASHTARTYPPKSSVFSQGDIADAVYYLRTGQIKLSRQSAHGKEAVVGLAGAGDFFGESCLASAARRTYTASAITTSNVMRVEKSVMLRMLRNEPRFSQVFIEHLVARNIRIEEDLVDQLFNFSEKRLARVLLSLSNVEHGEAATVHVKQAMLGEMIGTTRSRVNFFINKFRRLGYVEGKSVLRVRPSLLNVILHD
jgi:CRP-like cAMP-binding protein